MAVTCDPHLLQSLLEAHEGAGGDSPHVGVIARLANPERPVPHLDVVVRAGSVVTGRVLRTRLLDVRADANVLSLKRSRRYLPPETQTERDHAEPLRPAVPVRRFTGRGVVVGIADWGFDIGHHAYRRPTDRGEPGPRSRFVNLWDQRDRSGGSTPRPYGYGCEFDSSAIDAALRSGDPYAALGYDPATMDVRARGMHGTHALGIACASGVSPGVAPDAEIIAVHLRGDDTSPVDTLGDSARILEALDYVLTRAGDRPVVVNLSLGRTGGPHDSSPLIVQGIDAMLDAAPGRAVVMSAGNYYGTHQHISAQLVDGATTTWTWSVASPIGHAAELEIWYRSPDGITVELEAPDGTRVLHLEVGASAVVRDAGDVIVSGYHRAGEPNSGDNVVDLFLWRPAPPGRWKVHIHPTRVVHGEIHGWIERVSSGRQSTFASADPCFTTNSICNGERSIAVAAGDVRASPATPGHFSSCGPSRDLRHKPDVCAPGVAIRAPKSTVVIDGVRRRDEFTVMSGTSMAAPYVTGAVALMFEAAGRPLWATEVRDILLATARPMDGAPGRVGRGLVDVDAAIERTLGLTRRRTSRRSGTSAGAGQ